MLQNAGYIRKKTSWVRTSFSTCNFSFILGGIGWYERAGRRWKVAAPMVLIQLPGEYLKYGPMEDSGWEELYLVYERGTTKYWINGSLLEVEQPVWPVHSPQNLLRLIGEFKSLIRNLHGVGQADRLDMLAEALIMESRMPADSKEIPEEKRAMRTILEEVHRNWRELPDWSALAARHGLSDSSFRRRWAEMIEMPPGRYLLQLRMREARRRLVETRRTAAQIAEECGFSDPLYFSRCFRAANGLGVREYRKKYRR